MPPIFKKKQFTKSPLNIIPKKNNLGVKNPNKETNNEY